MFKTILVSAFLVTTTACSKKDSKSEGGAAAEKPATGNTATAASGNKYTCDTILSKAIRDTYFPNHKIENVEFPVKHSGKCKLTTADGNEFELSAACASFMKNSKDLTIEGLKKQFPDMKEVPGAGDVTLAQEIKGMDMIQFTSWSKGSFCQANGSLPKSVDTTAFLTEWLASLPTS